MPSTSTSFETPSFELEPLKTASSTALSVFHGDCVAPPDIAAAHNETDFENSSSDFVVPFERDHEKVVDTWLDGDLKEQSEMCDNGKHRSYQQLHPNALQDYVINIKPTAEKVPSTSASFETPYFELEPLKTASSTALSVFRGVCVAPPDIAAAHNETDFEISSSEFVVPFERGHEEVVDVWLDGELNEQSEMCDDFKHRSSQQLHSNALQDGAINIKPTAEKMSSTSALFETPSFELEPLKTASSTALSVLCGDCVAPPDIAAAHNEMDFENSSSDFVVPFEREHEEVVDEWLDGGLKKQSEMCDNGKKQSSQQLHPNAPQDGAVNIKPTAEKVPSSSASFETPSFELELLKTASKTALSVLRGDCVAPPDMAAAHNQTDFEKSSAEFVVPFERGHEEIVDVWLDEELNEQSEMCDDGKKRISQTLSSKALENSAINIKPTAQKMPSSSASFEIPSFELELLKTASSTALSEFRGDCVAPPDIAAAHNEKNFENSSLEFAVPFEREHEEVVDEWLDGGLKKQSKMCDNGKHRSYQQLHSNALQDCAINIKPTAQKMPSSSASFETPSFELEPLKTASSTALSVLCGDCVAPPDIAAARNEKNFENSSSEFVVPLKRDHEEVRAGKHRDRAINGGAAAAGGGETVTGSIATTTFGIGLHGWCPCNVVAISLGHAFFPLSCRVCPGHIDDVMDPYQVFEKSIILLVLVGVCLYFVTSSGCGSEVNNLISANGHENPPALQMVHWCWTKGLTAIVLVKAGSDEATKALRTSAFAACLSCTTAICFMRAAICRVVVLTSARSLLIVLSMLAFALTSNLGQTTSIRSRPAPASPEHEPHPLQWAVLIAEVFALVNYSIACPFSKTDRNKNEMARVQLGWRSPRQVSCLPMVFLLFIVPAAAALPRVPVNTAPPKQAYQGAGSSGLSLPRVVLEKGPLAASPPQLRLYSEASHWGLGVNEASSSHLDAAALKFAQTEAQVDKKYLLLEQKNEINQKQRVLLEQKGKEKRVLLGEQLEYERLLRQTTEHRLIESTATHDTATVNDGWLVIDNSDRGELSSELGGISGDEGGGTDTSLTVALPPSPARAMFLAAQGLAPSTARGGLIVSRRMSTVTVTTQNEFTAALANDVVIELSADITLTATMTISIDGMTGVVINGNGFKVDGTNVVLCFNIANGAEVSFNNLTITRGYYGNNGGGLFISGSVTVAMTSCTISENLARNSGAGLYITGSATVTMSLCTISENRAYYHSGGGLCITSGLYSPSATVTMTNCTISGNTANSKYGGGLIINSGTVTMSSCTISGNIAANGGGLFVGQSGTLVMTDCTISGNTTPHKGQGGGLSISGGTVTMSSCTISGSTSSLYAGGLLVHAATMSMTSCIISENTSQDGGGLYIGGSGILTMNLCTISKNTANRGGGLWITSNWAGTVTMTSCTISENTVSSTIYTSGYGGGLYLGSSATLTDCTISGNNAVNGGGLYIEYNTVTLTLCTISANNTTNLGGGLYISGSATMTDCTISGNNAANGGGLYIDYGAVLLTGCTFFGNSDSGSGGDIYGLFSSNLGTLEFYSLCPGGMAYAGTGSLSCDGCSGPADLSDTSSCTACIGDTPFACCGATACSASAPSCSATELSICPAPTSEPTLPLTMTQVPTISINPSPLPTLVPTPLPTPLTPLPTLAPTINPSPLPTLVPTVLPTPAPTITPSLTPVPTLVPTPLPTSVPTIKPSPLPTLVPTPLPTQAPTIKPSPLPTPLPTPAPTINPSPLPTVMPTPLPTSVPTINPSPLPTLVPTPLPTSVPTINPSPLPTLVPTPLPTSVPTINPSPQPSLVPIPLPTPAPTSLPSPLPTVVPTFGLGFLALEPKTMEAAVTATAAAAAVAVGGSIGGSVGASVGGSTGGTGGAGGGTAGSKTPAGNPLMLVFLVQGVFITSRLSDVPLAYSEMTAGFAFFNLEMAPPSWAKGFVMGSRRRLANEQDDFFDDLFNDETDASGLMRSHLFYMSIVIILVLGIHVTIYMIFAFKGVPVPTFLKFPGTEAWVFMALVMGMLDVSAQVLVNEKTAPGWKLVAAIELVIVLAFLCCIMILGRKFRQVTHWEPTPNVRRLRLADAWKILDQNGDGRVTLVELVRTGPKLGLTKTQATEMFYKLDENKSGAIDREEFLTGYKLEFVAVELTTPVERLWAYLFEPRRLGGTYTILDPESDRDLKQPSIALFTSFTPFHVHFLAFRIVIMVVESFALGGMHGWSQGLFLSLFSFAVFIKIVRNPPSVLLAQSRADTIDAAGRFLIYAIYSMVYPKWLTSSEAAQGMTLVIVLILIHSVYTQLDPLARAAIATLVAMFSGANTTAALPVRDTEDKLETSVVDEEEAQTMAINLDKLSSTAKDGRPQLVNEHIDDTSRISSQGSPLASRPNHGVYRSPTPRQGSTQRERSVCIDKIIQEHGERTVDTPSGSQGGVRDDGANASTHEAPLLSSTDGLACASSGGGGYYELPKLPRSPHAGAGRRYVTADENDATIADDDSTDTKFYEHEHRQQLQRSSDGTVSMVSLESLDCQPTSGGGGGGDGIKI